MAGKIEFGTYEPEVEENPYHEVITQLIEQGENASVTLTLNYDEVQRERNKFAKAANAQNKTARLRVTDDSKVKYGANAEGEQVPQGGTVALTFTLTERHKPRRRKGDTDAQGE